MGTKPALVVEFLTMLKFANWLSHLATTIPIRREAAGGNGAGDGGGELGQEQEGNIRHRQTGFC